MQNAEEFTCRDCHHKFPVEESVKDASRKRGIMERCKPCDRDRKKTHRDSPETGPAQRVKVRNATATLRRERRAAGMGWADSMTAEQLEKKRAASRLYNRLKRWAEIGASQEWYDQKMTEQGGRCGMCGSDQPNRHGEPTEVFCIDHNHHTGELRGLLCTQCNLVIGNAKDSPELLMAGVTYLAEYGHTVTSG